jgi:hypothetical protein
MTFKHSDFDDSSVMRSLVKVAAEKGWLPASNIAKTAANEKAQIDFHPSENLFANILKLCQGLRTLGLEKYADDLEVKYLNFKQANTLYNVSGEDGDDLLHSAHPKGSHKLVDVEGKEATVEDLLDKHLQFLGVVNKKPNGKLANHQILNQVMVVLAEEDLDSLYNKAAVEFEKFQQLYSGIARRLNEANNTNAAYFQFIQGVINKRDVYQNTNIENLLSASLDNLKNDKKPGFFATSEENQTWQNEVVPMFEIAYRYSNAFKNTVSTIRNIEAGKRTSDIKKEYDPEAAEKAPAAPVNVDDDSTKLVQNYNDTANTIGLYKARVSAKGLANADELNKWLDSAEAIVKKLGAEYSESQYKADPEIMQSYTTKLSNINAKLDAFKNKWLV